MWISRLSAIGVVTHGVDMKPCPIIIATGMGEFDCPIAVGASNCPHGPVDWDWWEKQENEMGVMRQRWRTQAETISLHPGYGSFMFWPPGSVVG